MWYFIIYIAFMSIAFCYFRAKNEETLSLITKILASLGFVLFSIFAFFLKSTVFTFQQAFIIVGAIFGLLGDVTIDVYNSTKDKKYMLVGVLSFALGHISYIISMMAIAKVLETEITIFHIIFTAGLTSIFTIIFILVSKIFGLEMGKITIMADCYLSILNFSTIFVWTCCALNGKFLTFAIGQTLFLASDLIWGFVHFGKKYDNNITQTVKRILYYAAQILICVTLLRI